MTALSLTSLGVVTLPVAGAALGLALRAKPETLKVSLLFTTIASLGMLGWAAGRLPPQPLGWSLPALVPIMAFASLLGQPAQPRHAPAWLWSMALLGLSLGTLVLEAPWAAWCLVAFLAVLGGLLLHAQAPGGFASWWSLGSCAAGAMAVAFSAAWPMSWSAALLAVAVLLPLPPFHRTYLAALTSLPGNLPAFLALAMPVVGLHALLTALPQLSRPLLDSLAIAVAVGSLYCSLRALTQTRPAGVIGYGAVAFLSIAWWYLAVTGTAVPQSGLYVAAVGLATGGLMVASFALRARFGEMGLRALSGLAQPMPRFAVLLSVLALAALGFPPFGVFAGFMSLLLAPAFAWTGSLIIIMLVWASASWYVFDLVQGLLFGGPPPVRRHHEDVREPEFAALALVVVLLLLLGVLPTRWLDVGSLGAERTIVMRPAWTK